MFPTGLCLDLQTGDRLMEEERQRVVVLYYGLAMQLHQSAVTHRVPMRPYVVELRIILGAPRMIQHIPQILQAFRLIPVTVDKVLFVYLQHECEKSQKRQ